MISSELLDACQDGVRRTSIDARASRRERLRQLAPAGRVEALDSDGLTERLGRVVEDGVAAAHQELTRDRVGDGRANGIGAESDRMTKASVRTTTHQADAKGYG
ncbi:hypothetical protein [Sorangium sp. So ce1000]|uniref:hypothetical protein n=1 Tax=Sorangium sp. So ce1000 TaxID=3133325 RepID=UPI003F601565